MKEIELDNWFFNLSACCQSGITGIAINEHTATDADYERFDDAVADWWDSLDYEDKLSVYETEEFNG